MKKKIIHRILFLIMITCLFSACSTNDDPNLDEVGKVSIELSIRPAVEGTLELNKLAGMTAVFTEVRNQDTTHCVIEKNGSGKVLLYKGTYNLSIEEKITNDQGNEVVISMRMENISINQTGQKIDAKVNSLPAEALGKNFIFSEIFFNGETNSGRMMHPVFCCIQSYCRYIICRRTFRCSYTSFILAK